jgi:outer membrane protein assembly factor BamB
MVNGDFADIPEWFEEGLASLYEVANTESDGQVTGKPNWRGAILADSARERPAVSEILKGSPFAADAQTSPADIATSRRKQATYLAQIRYLALYLQDRQALVPLYLALKNRDPLKAFGESQDLSQILEGILGKQLTEIQADFDGWLTGAIQKQRVNCGAVDASGRRVLNSDKDLSSWLRAGGSLAALNFSRINQISRSNVGSLRVAWSHALPSAFGVIPSTPLVMDGVLYYAGSHGFLYALDGMNGKVIWRYRQPSGDQTTNPATRAMRRPGIAASDCCIFMVAPDGQLAAVGKRIGQAIWSGQAEDKHGVAMTAIGVPLYAKGILMVFGISSDSRRTPKILGIDAREGKTIWEFAGPAQATPEARGLSLPDAGYDVELDGYPNGVLDSDSDIAFWPFPGKWLWGNEIAATPGRQSSIGIVSLNISPAHRSMPGMGASTNHGERTTGPVNCSNSQAMENTISFVLPEPVRYLSSTIR